MNTKVSHARPHASDPDPDPALSLGANLKRVVAYSGIFFFLVSALALLAMIWLSLKPQFVAPLRQRTESATQSRPNPAAPSAPPVSAPNDSHKASPDKPTAKESDDKNEAFPVTLFVPMFLFCAAVFSAGMGYLLLRTAGAATRRVIPWEDYEILKALLYHNNQPGIDSYIRLSSLTGFIGVFTKIGLSGLPLATIGLTIIFAILGLFSGTHKELFDFAKLTLGAFIGSYVQRSALEGQKSAETQSRSQRPTLNPAEPEPRR
jgi:amino acid transporter